MLRVYRVYFDENSSNPNNTYVLAISPSEAEWLVSNWLEKNNRKEDIFKVKFLSPYPEVKTVVKTKGVLETLTAWNNLQGK
jgi:hypothetical protein